MVNNNVPMVDTMFDSLSHSKRHTLANVAQLVVKRSHHAFQKPRPVDAENVIALIPSAWQTNDACCSYKKEMTPLLLVMESNVRCHTCKSVKQAQVG
jgi:hypothetical protein